MTLQIGDLCAREDKEGEKEKENKEGKENSGTPKNHVRKENKTWTRNLSLLTDCFRDASRSDAVFVVRSCSAKFTRCKGFILLLLFIKLAGACWLAGWLDQTNKLACFRVKTHDSLKPRHIPSRKGGFLCGGSREILLGAQKCQNQYMCCTSSQDRLQEEQVRKNLKCIFRLPSHSFPSHLVLVLS